MRELLEARDLDSEWHGQREREGRRASENVGSARIRIGRAPESRTVLEMEPGPVQRSLADMQAELRSIREAYADAEHREEIAAEAYDE
jgi:hypothetical protein